MRDFRLVLGWRAVCTVALILGWSAKPIAAQTNLNPDQLDHVVNTITDLLRDFYLFEDPGRRMADRIHAQFESGAYTGLEVRDLSARITIDLQEVTDDRHMYLRWDPEAVAASGVESSEAPGPQRRQLSSEMVELFRQRGMESNFGLPRFQWLPERVGYVLVSEFSPFFLAQATYESLIGYFENAQAMIFDVRGNPGGSPDGVRLLQANFFADDAVLLSFTDRAAGTSFDQTVEADSEGIWQGIPIYILIDGGSGSAAEDFAYTSANAGEAILVGDPTAGAAHMNRIYPVQPGFQLSISTAGPVSPVTHGNWEGTGVQPTIRVPSPEARLTAYREILEKLKNAASSVDDQSRIELRLEETTEALAHVREHDARLDEFVGTYDEYEVEVVGNALRLASSGRETYYVRVGRNLFERVGSGVTSITFERLGDRPVSLVISRNGVEGPRQHRASGERA